MQNQGSQNDKILPGTPRVTENIGQISCSTDRQTHKKTDRGQGERWKTKTYQKVIRIYNL